MFFIPELMLLFRVVFGAVFLFAFFTKIYDLRAFYMIVLQYGLLKPFIAKPLAYSQPFMELILGIMLIYGGELLPVVSFLSLIMMLTATFFVAYAYFGKRKMENCGCYGITVKIPISKAKIIENIIWDLMLIYVFLGSLYGT